MWGGISWALALLLASTCAFADSRGLTRAESAEVFDGDENYAVIVGIDQYENVPDLRHAVDDARRLESLLEAQGYRTFTLTDYKANPTRILGAVRKAGRLATNEGRERQGSVVFAFSGHGFHDGRTNYLATADADVGNPDDGESLALGAVIEALEETGVRQRVMLVDACRNVPGSRGIGADGQGFVEEEPGEGVAVLFGTGREALSWEDPALGHGVFTHYLAEGLEGAAAGDDGLVTFERLRRYVERRVKRHVIEAFDEVQVPWTRGERTGEFVLARVEREPPLPGRGRLTVAVEPEDARVRIMNIGPRYEPGMELALGGEYDVLVEREGYEPYRKTVVIERAKHRLDVTLSQRIEIADPVAFAAARPPDSDGESMRQYRGCEDGDAAACIEIGEAYQFARTTSRRVDLDGAAAFYGRGCVMGNAGGCTKLGLLRSTKDVAQAAPLYARGCDAGDSTGCVSIGWLYERGRGVEQDLNAARRLYRRGCELGEKRGCLRMERL